MIVLLFKFSSKVSLMAGSKEIKCNIACKSSYYIADNIYNYYFNVIYMFPLCLKYLSVWSGKAQCCHVCWSDVVVPHPLGLCHTGDRSVPTRSRLNCKSPAFCWRPRLNWPFAAGHSCVNVKSEGQGGPWGPQRVTWGDTPDWLPKIPLSLWIWTITLVCAC